MNDVIHSKKTCEVTVDLDELARLLHGEAVVVGALGETMLNVRLSESAVRALAKREMWVPCERLAEGVTRLERRDVHDGVIWEYRRAARGHLYAVKRTENAVEEWFERGRVLPA